VTVARLAVAMSLASCMATNAPSEPATDSQPEAVGPQPLLLFGNASIASVADNSQAGQAEAFAFTAVASGILQSLKLYVDSPDSARSVDVGVYDKTGSGGSPGHLLAACTIAHPSKGAWNTCSVTNGPSTGRGSTYWVAVLGPAGGGTPAYRDENGGTSYSSESTTLSSFGPTYGVGASWASTKLSVQGLGGPGSAADAGHAAPPDAGTSKADAGTGHSDAGVGRADADADGSHVPDAGLKTSDCFAAPGACGYPDPNYGTVGATAPCSSLKASGSVTVSTSGETVEGLNITGSLTIAAPNVTVNNVCVTASGNSGVMAVWVESNATNLLLEHSTFAGADSSGIGVIDTGVFNASDVPSVTGDALYIYNAAEDWHGSGTLKNSYVQAGAVFTDSEGPSHNEDVYLSDSSWSGDHNTLLNSDGQTAVLFGDNNGGAKGTPGDNHWTVTNSLLAGGGWLMYANAGATTVGSSTMNISNNRIARCKTTSVFDGSGYTCSGGPDEFGYFPRGGYYGGPVDIYCPPTAGQTWSNNVWDDDGSQVSCQ
jgi:hypothetical protein